MENRPFGSLVQKVSVAAITASSFLATLPARAQALTKDELFGGVAADDFAGAAGLGNADLPTMIASIIKTILGFLGIVAVIIILFGGFKWMTSGGNDDKVTEARKLIISGIIGLVIVVSAFAIASFVITQIAGVTQA